MTECYPCIGETRKHLTKKFLGFDQCCSLPLLEACFCKVTAVKLLFIFFNSNKTSIPIAVNSSKTHVLGIENPRLVKSSIISFFPVFACIVIPKYIKKWGFSDFRKVIKYPLPPWTFHIVMHNKFRNG